MTAGYITLELAPFGHNPRNSEGSFMLLRDGRIRFIYSRFDADTGHDDANCDIAEVLSSDGGESWTQPRILFRASECGADNLMSVSLLRLGNGDIGLFYLVKEGWQSRYILRRSADEGESWSEPVDCMTDPGYKVVNNDRVIRLDSGRLVIPAAVHPPKGVSEGFGRNVRSDSFDIFYLSDDDGHSWRQSRDAVAFFSSYNSAGLQEPGAVALAKGILWGYARTELGRQYEFFSLNGGECWTQPQPSQFTSPCSPMQIKRSPFDGRLLAVWNPAPEYPTRKDTFGGGRNPLVCAVSQGDMTFSEPLILEQEPLHGYCYPAVCFTDAHTALLAYCSGGVADKGCLNRLTIRKIEL